MMYEILTKLSMQQEREDIITHFFFIYYTIINAVWFHVRFEIEQ